MKKLILILAPVLISLVLATPCIAQDTAWDEYDFDQYDTDRDGLLSYDEYDAVWGGGGEIGELTYDAYDYDDDDSWTEEEFNAFNDNLLGGEYPEDIGQMTYEAYDYDDDGFWDRNEFEAFGRDAYERGLME